MQTTSPSPTAPTAPTAPTLMIAPTSMIAPIVVLLAVVSLAGCGADAGGGDGSSSADSARDVPALAERGERGESRAGADGGEGLASGSEAATGEGSAGPARAIPGTSAGGAEPAPPLRPPPPAVGIPEDPPKFERPEHVRGIYLNAWTAGSPARLESLVRLARETEVNTFVIDLKDVSGYVSYPTGVEAAREAGAVGQVRISDPVSLLRRLEAEGIYPIARIVIVKDPILLAHRPELGVQDTAGGVWVDSNGIRWLNPYHAEVADYHLALAREAAALGFPEIQWDYVRFPDAPRSDLRRATYPGSGGRTRSQAIRAFLARSRADLEPLGVLTTADVFGATTSAGDIGIGQVWEDFIDVVDAALPMVYPSHYWPGAFGMEDPVSLPYEVVRRALGHAVRRSEAVEGAGRVVPWLQDFSMGFPEDRVPDIRAQMQAAYDVGIREWILWNPASRYTRAALAPSGGWRRGEGPPIRVAGRLVRVEDRFALLDLPFPGEEGRTGDQAVRAGADDAEPVKGGSGDRGADRDGLPYRVLDPDSLRRHLDSLLIRDTVRIGRDTVRRRP